MCDKEINASFKGQCDPKVTVTEVHPNIFKSPYTELVAKIKIPEVSVTDFLFKSLEMNYEILKDEIWVADIIKGTSYKFGEIKPLATKIASALTRMGFKKGDVLYFVTYDVALIYVIQIGVWMCGGAVRGCFQREDKEEFKRQMAETSTRFILCDSETAKPVKWAAEQLDWPIHLLSIGREIEGATAVEEMIKNEDSSAFPNDVQINQKEDVISIPNTSGSTGLPKGAMHTHFNIIALASIMGAPVRIEKKRVMGKSFMTLMGNFAVGTFASTCLSILFGYSFYGISKFDQKEFLRHILKYKIKSLAVYPYVASWLARTPELDKHDFSFIKRISCGGSVLDAETCKLLSTKFPQARLMQGFGSTECLIVSASETGALFLKGSCEEESIAGLKLKKLDGKEYISSGILLPLVEAKIMDPSHGCTVGPNIKGNLWLRSPFFMKGYVSRDISKGYVSEFDENGWLNTGDLAFFDEIGHLYIVERSSSIFKYYMHQVSPAEIEAVIGEHPAVLSVGVVGVPDLVTTSVARAYVVLKPGCQVTEEEIKKFVSERKIFYKQLHGGVEFVEILPVSRGGKLDRVALLRRATEELKSNVEKLSSENC